MLRTSFERELQSLQDRILTLGSFVEENLIKSIVILRRHDIAQAHQLIQSDTWVNEQRIRIGLDALTLIATQQPIAGDMRRIAAIIEIVGELERIHDYIKGIARITTMLGPAANMDNLIMRYPEIAEKARDMMHRALTAFATRNATLARQIPPEDDEVDTLYKQTYREILQHVMQNPETIEKANLIEWALHNLERSADRVTNICEWIVYMVEGRYLEMDTELEAPPAN